MLTLLMMVLIFLFSTESADTSDRTSDVITRPLIRVTHPRFDEYPPEKKQEVYSQMQHVVRKCAHFTEYMALGLLMRLCLFSWLGRRKGGNVLAWGIGTLYAGTDELHQLLVDGRAGQWQDVLLDSCGVLAGVLIAMVILKISLQREAKRKTT